MASAGQSFTCTYTKPVPVPRHLQGSRKRVRLSSTDDPASTHKHAECLDVDGRYIEPAQGVGDIAPSISSAQTQQTAERGSTTASFDEMNDFNIHTGSTEFHGSNGVLPLLSKLRLRARQSQSRSQSNCELHETSPSLSLLSYIHEPEYAGSSTDVSLGATHPSQAIPQPSGLLLEKQAVQMFFNNLHVVHPFLDQRAFILRCAKLVWDRSTPYTAPLDSAHSHFLALYSAVMAVGLITADDISTLPDAMRYSTLSPDLSNDGHHPVAQKAAEHYFQQAKLHLGDVFQSTSIDGTSAIFLLSVYCQNALRQHSCYLYSGMAVRTAIAIGVPSTNTKDFPSISRLWWSLYSHEMEMCTSVGRLSALEDLQTYDMGLPVVDGDTPQALIAHMVRFAVVLRQVPQKWQRTAQSIDIAARSRETRSIYQMLKEWRESLNPELDFDQPSLTDSGWRLQQKVVLKLRFLNACIVLHRPFLLLLAQDSSNTELLEQVHLCVQASIDTIDTLYDSYLQRPSFRMWWYNAVYLLYASMVVLYTLLSDVSGWSREILLNSAKRGIGVLDTMKSNKVAARIALVVREVLDIAIDFTASKDQKRAGSGTALHPCPEVSRIPMHAETSQQRETQPDMPFDWSTQDRDLEDLFNNLVDSSLFADWLQDQPTIAEVSF